jgi:O-antigen/teichoic acid export membrane protein
MFLIVPLVTVVSMALFPRFCSIEKSLRPRAGRYLAYLGVPSFIAMLLLSYISGVIFLHIFGIQVIWPLLLVLAIYSALFFYNRVWDKLVTACEGAKIVAWGVTLETITLLSVMVISTPSLGGMLAIATGMVSGEIVYGVVLLSWFRLDVVGKREPKTIND